MPLLSLAHELKVQSPNCQIVYIGYKGDNFDTFKESTHNFDFTAFIRAGKFRRYHDEGFLSRIFDFRTLALNVRDFLLIPGSVVASLRILRQFRPNVVFSKGGFVVVPVGLAARLLRVPIVTHDSDAVPGLANRIVGRWAKIHATGMPPENYPYSKHSLSYVGIPIDPAIKKVTPKLQDEFKKKLNLPQDSTIILLAGGGNGSKKLNDLMVTISRRLLDSNLALHIIHVTGTLHEQTVRTQYKTELSKEEQKRVKITGFSNDFFGFAAVADLVISRAGATTLAELAMAGKACIIIPSPFLAGGHQLKNAEILAKRDAVVMVGETIEPDEFLVMVSELLNNDHRRWELAKNLYATANPDAASKLAHLILKAAELKA